MAFSSTHLGNFSSFLLSLLFLWDFTHAADIPTHQTVLQKHVGFFDRDKDGVIYPWETFQGFLAIGVDVAFSNTSAASIHAALSPITRPGKPPSSKLPIDVANIHLAKHGSDTDVYDTEGKFVCSKFEEIFTKHSTVANGTALTKDDIKEMLKANRQPGDEIGRAASTTAWTLLYKLAKDENGLLQKDTIKDVYDGSLFYTLEEKNKKD